MDSKCEEIVRDNNQIFLIKKDSDPDSKGVSFSYFTILPNLFQRWYRTTTYPSPMGDFHLLPKPLLICVLFPLLDLRVIARMAQVESPLLATIYFSA
jgi:hypothetical protein